MRIPVVVAIVLSLGNAWADRKPAPKKPPPLPAEAQFVSDFFAATHAAPDKAFGQLAKSVKQAVALREGNCLKKSKVAATITDDKGRKAFVKCVGEWAEFANFSPWEVQTLADINPAGAKGFAKKLPKDSKIVMGSHSDGFIIVGLASKDSALSIIGVYVDLSSAE